MRSPAFPFEYMLLIALMAALPSEVRAQKADSVLAAMTSQPDTSKIIALNLLSKQTYASDLVGSRQLADKALEVSRGIDFRKGEAEALRNIANVLMRQGQFTQALEHCTEAAEIYTSLGDQSGIADILNTTGMVHNQQGQYALALEKFTEALKIRQALGQKQFMSMLIENIGIIHFRQGDYRLALEFFQECLQVYTDLGNEGAASKILVNIGATYNKLNMPEAALEAHQKSLTFFEKTNSQLGLSIAYNNIGSVYFTLKDYRKAIDSYTKSLELKKKLNDKRGTAVSLANLAEAHMMLNELDKAKQNINESLLIAEEIGSMEQVKAAYEMLSKLHEKSRDFEKALIFERKMSVARDSLFSADKTAQISKMRAIYETDKAEQSEALTKLESAIEIGKREQERNLFIIVAALLLAVAGMVFYLYREKRQTNRLLSEKNTIVERSLHERETLLKEIHHRVKNNLQIISSLLSLQSKSLHDTEAQGAISESRNRVKSMSLIHEQLYQDDTISGVDMKDYIQRLVNSLTASYALDTERVQINVEAEPLLLDVDTAIPLGLIMNELVSNSMKYAFPEVRAGIIKVSLQETVNELRLVVEDNGVGIDPSKATGQSFGLSMVRSLMRKLKADMNIGSKAGTSVELIIRDFKKVTFA